VVLEAARRFNWRVCCVWVRPGKVEGEAAGRKVDNSEVIAKWRRWKMKMKLGNVHEGDFLVWTGIGLGGGAKRDYLQSVLWCSSTDQQLLDRDG
jgi:hypothetical protein